MRKKRGKTHKKRPKVIAPIDEEKIARLEEIKLNREKTIAMVKLRLNEKFNKRISIIRENMLIEDNNDDQKNLRSKTKSLNEKKMTEIREEMKKVISAGVEKVNSVKILKDKIKFDAKSSTMNISGKKYKIKKNVHVVGWGLEALMMGSTLEKIIGDHLKKGWIVVPRKTIAKMIIYPEWFPRLNTRIICTEASSDDTPDEACVRATKNIIDYCKKLKKKDILIILLSPSTEELMCLPKGTIGLREKLKLLSNLRNAGAVNQEIDVVRTTLSAIRGGELARSAYPAKVISLVMSDGGPNDLLVNRIAGGPSMNEDLPVTRSKAQSILEKYGLDAHMLSQSIREILSADQRETANMAEKSKMVDQNGNFKFVSNYVAASSNDAIDGMAISAFQLGYLPIKLPAKGTIDVSLDVRKVTKEYVKIISLMILAVENKIQPTEMYEALKNSRIFDIGETKLLEMFPSRDKWSRGLYILMGPPLISDSVKKIDEKNEILEPNKTGNNQEFALYFSLYWYLRIEQYPILKKYVVWFLGCASNGKDGNTEYAGAYGYDNLGVDVYRQYKQAHYSKHSKRSVDGEFPINRPDMMSQKTDEFGETFEDKRRALHETILPDRVLTSGNSNLLFLNVNDGEELVKIGDSSGYTFTNIGDLHIFRIVRYQCSCDGQCLHSQ